MRKPAIFRADRDGQPIDSDTDVAEEAITNVEVERLRALMSQLPALERRVLQWRFGIGCEPMTLREVGHTLGWSASKVLNVERRALLCLRVAWTPDQYGGLRAA